MPFPAVFADRVVGPGLDKGSVFVHIPDAVAHLRLLGRGNAFRGNPAHAHGAAPFRRRFLLPGGRFPPPGAIRPVPGCVGGAQHDILLLLPFPFPFFQILHLPGQHVPGVRGAVRVAEFIHPDIGRGRPLVPQVLLPVHPRGRIDIQRRAASDTMGHGRAVPLPAFRTFHLFFLILLRPPPGSCSSDNPPWPPGTLPSRFPAPPWRRR